MKVLVILFTLVAFITGCSTTVVVKQPTDSRTEQRAKDAFSELDKNK